MLNPYGSIPVVVNKLKDTSDKEALAEKRKVR
jgi:hypothetical protein